MSKSEAMAKRLNSRYELGWEERSLMAAELRRLAAVEAELERIKPAWDEWQKKTEWVQDTCQPKELGLHRADVLRMRIEGLQAEFERIRALEPVAWMHPPSGCVRQIRRTPIEKETFTIPCIALTKDPT